MKLFAATSLCLVLAALNPVQAQNCTPPLHGFDTGPYLKSNNSQLNTAISDLMPFDDGSGPALIASGRIYLPHAIPFANTSYVSSPAAKFQDGHWTPMPAPFPLPEVGLALANADFSASGGPGPSIYSLLGGRTYRWDGANWTLTDSSSRPGAVTLLACSDAQGPLLLAGGTGIPVCAWRGSGSWTPYGVLTPSPSTSVSKLRLLDDGSGPAVFAIGDFRDDIRNLRGAAKFVNGAWTQCGLSPDALAYSYITDLAYFDDGTSTTGPELYVAWISVIGTGYARSFSVSRLRNGVWELVAQNFPTLSTFLGPRLEVISDQGTRHLYCTADTSGNVLEWTPAGWIKPISVRGAVNSIVRFDAGEGEQTWFGGEFSSFFEGPAIQGNPRVTPAFSLVHTSPQGITSPAKGIGLVNSSPGFFYLSALEFPDQPRLMVGGLIKRAGGRPANNCAMFDGRSWFNFDPTLSLGEFRDATVAPINGEPRIIAARFNQNNLFYWDGSLWQTLPAPQFARVPLTFNNTLYAYRIGSGLPSSPGILYRYTGATWDTAATVGFSTAIVADLGNGPRILLGSYAGLFEFDGATLTQIGPAQVGTYAMAVVNDGPGPRVYIASTNLPNRIARLTNGAWEPLPPGIQNTAGNLALASFDDGNGPALYVANHTPSLQYPGFVRRWRNNEWSEAFPSSGADDNGTAALAVVGDRLYIAGNFSQLGPVTADHLAYIQACPRTCTADFNGDGDIGTDADIEAFFTCLAGNCCTRCTADFNNDGDIGTDADIESFFRVLAGGAC